MQRLRLLRITDELSADGHKLGQFLCECGKEKTIIASRVRNGYVVSCGCYRPGNVKHGKRNSPEYGSWQAMLRRCHDETHKDYPRYGARGIEVFPAWRESFEAFWEGVGPRPEGTTLDRIDGRRGYVPGNVRWATPRQQSRNRTDLTVVNTPAGTMALVDYAVLIGITKGAAHLRLKRGKLEGVSLVD